MIMSEKSAPNAPLRGQISALDAPTGKVPAFQGIAAYFQANFQDEI